MNLQALRDHRFATLKATYTDKDTMLYALSVGAGLDPLNEKDLGLVYEGKLSALPSMAAVLAHPGPWITQPQFAVNFVKLLHGEQNLRVHRPLPAQGELQANYKVTAVQDKGEGKGALVFFEKQLTDAKSNELLCTVSSTLFCRGDGGSGSFGTPPEALSPAPAGEMQPIGELKTDRRAALWYRLNGDRNPIHVDPRISVNAGFKEPILHGLCTYGVVGYLIVRDVCGYDTSKLLTLDARFSSPVMPGESIRLDGQRTADGLFFQAVVPERNQVVMSQGFARIAA